MSFLSGSTKNLSQPEQKPLGLETQRLGTNEMARPVPVVYGTREVGLTFLTQAFDQQAVPRIEDFGKEERVIGFYYSASFAALLCHGPIDALNWIKFDGVKIWPTGEDPVRARDTTVRKVVRIKVLTQGIGYTAETAITIGSGATPATARAVVKSGRIVEVIVTGQGSGYDPESPPSVTADIGTGATFEVIIGSETFVDLTLTWQSITFTWRFHWGLRDTDYDPKLLELSPDEDRNPLENGVVAPNEPENHPAYAGLCYLVAMNHYLGYNQTNVQQITISVSRWPEHDWMESGANVLGDCNPVAVLAEDITNSVYGLGVPATRLNQENLNEIAGILAAEGNGVSPVVSQTSSFRQHLLSLLEYFDGYQYTDNQARLCLGLIRETPCSVGDPLTPYYDEESLTKPPEFKPMGWDETANYVYVKFTNRDKAFEADSAGAPNMANLQITGSPSIETLQRPWFTRAGAADSYARAAAQIMGIPRQTGSISVRRSRLQGLEIGRVFKLQYGHLGLCYLWCRATEIRFADDYRPEVEIQFEVDRGYLAQQTYQPPVYVPPAKITHPVEPIEHLRLVELPYMDKLTKPGGPHVLALVARPTGMTTAWIMHLIDDGTSRQLKKSQNFAWHGTQYSLGLNIGATTLTVQLDGVDLVLPSITSVDSSVNPWLLFLEDEILSIVECAPAGVPGRYDLTVLRERFDTKRRFHANGVELFIISRAQATGCVVDDTQAQVVAWAPPNTVEFKVQPVVLGTGQDLAEVDVSTVQFTGRSHRYWKPRDLAVNGTSLTEASYVEGGDIVVSWTPVSRLGQDFESNLQDLWVIDFYDALDELKLKLTAAASADALTVTNAELVAAFGEEPAKLTIKIYAQQIKNGNAVDVSMEYDEIGVVRT